MYMVSNDVVNNSEYVMSNDKGVDNEPEVMVKEAVVT
jgi:hypothetical protein